MIVNVTLRRVAVLLIFLLNQSCTTLGEYFCSAVNFKQIMVVYEEVSREKLFWRKTNFNVSKTLNKISIKREVPLDDRRINGSKLFPEELSFRFMRRDKCVDSFECEYYEGIDDRGSILVLDKNGQKILYLKHFPFEATEIIDEMNDAEMTSQSSPSGQDFSLEKSFRCQGDGKSCLQFGAENILSMRNLCVDMAVSDKGEISEGRCKVETSGLPIRYGKWCGQDYGGSKKNEPMPDDLVDEVCMEHDLCYNEKGAFSCGCDRELLRVMPAAIRRTSMPDARVAGTAAVTYFSASPCHCRKIWRYRCFNKGRWTTCEGKKSYPGTPKACPFGGE